MPRSRSTRPGASHRSAARGGHACARTPRFARPPAGAASLRVGGSPALDLAVGLAPASPRAPPGRAAGCAPRSARAAPARRWLARAARRSRSRRPTSSPSSADVVGRGRGDRAELSFELNGRRLGSPFALGAPTCSPPAPPAAPPAASPPAAPPAAPAAPPEALHVAIALNFDRGDAVPPRRRGRRGRRQLRRGVGVAASARCRLPRRAAWRARRAPPRARAPVWRV